MLAVPALTVLAASKKESEAAPVPDQTVLRIMTYNIHHGRGLDENVDLERIADLIKKENPHVVGLQEVDKGVRRTDGRDLTAELAKLTGMEGYFVNNFHYQGGEYGNAILTRLPILEKKNTHFRMIREGEQRGAIQMLLDVEGQKLLFVNTHIDFRGDDTERLLNIEQFKEIVGEHPDVPAIFVGDFNARPDTRTHARMAKNYIDIWEVVGQGEGYTFPADKPDRRIDYVWLSTGGKLTPLGARVISTEASDHRPLMTEIGLNK